MELVLWSEVALSLWADWKQTKRETADAKMVMLGLAGCLGDAREEPELAWCQPGASLAHCDTFLMVLSPGSALKLLIACGLGTSATCLQKISLGFDNHLLWLAVTRVPYMSAQGRLQPGSKHHICVLHVCLPTCVEDRCECQLSLSITFLPVL